MVMIFCICTFVCGLEIGSQWGRGRKIQSNLNFVSEVTCLTAVDITICIVGESELFSSLIIKKK